MTNIRMIKLDTIKWVGHAARMGEKKNACNIVVGRHQETRLTEGTRCRWEDDIKMYIGEI
jgi:hypothetical protein